MWFFVNLWLARLARLSGHSDSSGGQPWHGPPSSSAGHVGRSNGRSGRSGQQGPAGVERLRRPGSEPGSLSARVEVVDLVEEIPPPPYMRDYPLRFVCNTTSSPV